MTRECGTPTIRDERNFLPAATVSIDRRPRRQIRPEKKLRMAPAERIPLPFRWQFNPLKDEKTGAILWTWGAYSQTGALVMESERTFDTLTACISDAKSRGYDNP
jgi:hypothetical protein